MLRDGRLKQQRYWGTGDYILSGQKKLASRSYKYTLLFLFRKGERLCSYSLTMNLTVTSESPLLTAQFLRTLPAVRERCAQVFELAKRGQLKYFDYHPEHEQDVTQFCIGLMKRDFGSNWAKVIPSLSGYSCLIPEFIRTDPASRSLAPLRR